MTLILLQFHDVSVCEPHSIGSDSISLQSPSLTDIATTLLLEFSFLRLKVDFSSFG